MSRDNFNVNLSILIFRDISILHFVVVYMLNRHDHDKYYQPYTTHEEQRQHKCRQHLLQLQLQRHN